MINSDHNRCIIHTESNASISWILGLVFTVAAFATIWLFYTQGQWCKGIKRAHAVTVVKMICWTGIILVLCLWLLFCTRIVPGMV